MRAPGRGSRLLAHLLSRLRSGGDREHEMLGNRLAIGLIVAAYALLVVRDDVPAAHALRTLCGVYLAAALLLLADVLLRPGPSRLRRLAAAALDTGVLSWGFHLGGPVAAPFFPVYLWIILGNGFRFGLPWLRLATGLSVVGFGLVVWRTPYWALNRPLGLGLLAGLLAIPLYAATLIRRLSDARRQAEEASHAKSLFLASVSHELRTPLNAVIGMGDLLGATRLDAEQRDMADTIRGAAASLLSLIDGVLDLSRIEAGRMPVSTAAFDLAGLLREVLATVAAQAREKRLLLALHVSSRTPLDLAGDARHLREILLNLLGNAVKFTPSGSVVLAADAVADGPAAVRLRFEVTDTGIGIADAAQRRVFDDFAQADNTIMNRFGGTGLGLAITRRLVRLLGGQVGVRSAEGAGSTFWLELPLGRPAPPRTAAPGGGVAVLARDAPALGPVLERLHRWGCEVVTCHDPDALRRAVAADRRLCALLRGPAPDRDARAPSAPALPGTGGAILVADGEPGLPAMDIRRRFVTVVPTTPSEAQLRAALRVAGSGPAAAGAAEDATWRRPRPARVLVADDNRVNQKVVGKILERAGHAIRVVGDGEQALDALAEAEFDLVLMDLNMPVMDGLEATKLFRFASLGGRHVPVVGLTADATAGARERCREAGMDACLVKPVQARALLDAVDALLAGTPDREALPAAPVATQAGPASPPVADIASHPRFRPAAGPAVDAGALRQLEALGGREFLRELADEFLADAARLIDALARSATEGDAAAVGAHVHALQSAAGNMGAEPLRQMLRAIQLVGPANLSGEGTAWARQLTAELDRVRQALLEARPPAGRAGQPGA